MYGRQGEIKSTVGTSDSGLYFPCVNDLSLETVVPQKRRKKWNLESVTNCELKDGTWK